MKTTTFALCLIWALTISASGQDKIFNWLPANDETVRLDPAFYHNGRTYHPGPHGGNMHVDIDAQLPVTIAMTSANGWSRAVGHTEDAEHLSYSCVQQHVVKATDTCNLPPEPMVRVIRDERYSARSTIVERTSSLQNGNSGIVASGTGAFVILSESMRRTSVKCVIRRLP